MDNDFQGFLQTLKDKSNIVEVASGYFNLERRGANYWACCPFHHEKTPSFAINEPDQFYHCFGCGESGDVIKLVCAMENVDFMDGVKVLAKRANLPMPKTEFDGAKTVETKRKKDACLQILVDTAHFYLKNLNSGNADEHIAYILKREIPSNIVRRFGLGASLDFTSLPTYLLKKGYSRQDMIDSGVVSEANGRLTDSQGGRLIFPIINAMDEVIGFGGRALKKVDFGKYKNTKDTLVFNKRKTLYNINLLKKLKREQTISSVIIVEGYMDTLSLYQAGFKNVVASMGTSLTQDQARLIKRYTDNVFISYDGDGAGQKANMRGLEILKSEGLNVKVVPLPDGLDPDDVIKQQGAEGYQKCLDNALPLIDYKLKTAASGLDLQKTEDKRKYVADALRIIRTADSAAEQEDLLKTLRDETGITFEALKRDLGDTAAPQKAAEKPAAEKRKDTSTGADKASRYVIAAYLFGGRLTENCPVDSVPFTNDVHKITANYVRGKALLGERVQPAELLEFFEENTPEYDELTRILDYCDGDAFSREEALKTFSDCVKTLKLNDITARIDSLKAIAEKESDTARIREIMGEIQRLIKLKEKIRCGD